ncbi:MAG TPA: hypothetical protein VK604_26040, partial [Bryobacteraceae bacterium]|nr:hypothetical protein [Bryobacteraceae bacterium]
LERSISRSLKELQRLKDLRPDTPGPASPHSEQQNSQEQSQTPVTETESTTSDDQPITACVLKATSTAAGHNSTDCIQPNPNSDELLVTTIISSEELPRYQRI